jgi:hypothetical protein
MDEVAFEQNFLEYLPPANYQSTNAPFCHLSFRASTIGPSAAVVTRKMVSPYPKKKTTNLHIFQSWFACVWLNVITESMAHAFVSSLMFAEVNMVRDKRVA